MTRSTWSGWGTATPQADNVDWPQLAPGSSALELYSEAAQELRRESSSQDGTADGTGSRGWTPIANNRTHEQERRWGHGMPDWLLCPASQIEYSFLIRQSPDSRVCRSGAACPWLISGFLSPRCSCSFKDCKPVAPRKCPCHMVKSERDLGRVESVLA